MDLGAEICTPKRRLRAMPFGRAVPGTPAQCRSNDWSKDLTRFLITPLPLRCHPANWTVLIALRPPSGLLGGLWEFPGGKLQPGETLAQALQREICEELQAEIAVEEPFGVYRHAFTHFRITLHAFRCRLVDGEPSPVEASDIRWVLPEELPGYPMGKVDRQIASRLVSHIARHKP
jgi:A/G-specific adenine glycosylase